MHNQYVSQMIEIKNGHNSTIEKLMFKYKGQQINSQSLLENNEWFKVYIFNQHIYIYIYKQKI